MEDGCVPATCWFCSAPRPSLETAGLRVPLGNNTCGRSDFSGSARGPRAGLGGRRAAHPDRRGSRETPEAQESYLGCRRCPPVPGILGLRFARPPGSAVAFAGAGEAPTRAQAPPSGRAEAARGPRPGGGSERGPGRKCSRPSHVGGWPARLRTPGADPRRPAPPSLRRGRWDPNLLNFLSGAARASQALAPGLGAILGFSWLHSEICLFSRQLLVRPSLAQPLSEIIWEHPKMQGTGFLSSPGRPFRSHQPLLLFTTPHPLALLPTLFPPLSLAEVY